MPKVERAQLRTRLLTECGDFTEIDGELQCKFCTTKVPNLKKSSIVQHLKTKRHRENKQRSQQDEAVQEEGLEDEETVEQQPPPAQKNFNRDLCKALISSNIPLNKVNSTPFSSFLLKYTAYTVQTRVLLGNTMCKICIRKL
ncbi:uncharacterized protein LOC119588012 isoform X2 [Penaeus monodon]|uniref:uncharacterized protein LOC119588012 isoform X2 n=1 Tax=Penaeus monodon TaxID=6687 RepID=UPI0018A78886|nr:uncharacterized protein LOC119588012 isoform X2 [Penaeus monodon]